MDRNYIDLNDKRFENIALNGSVYVDKTQLISLLNCRIHQENRFVCISRPRRFGKSLTASMICSYYSKGQDSHELFKKYKIVQEPSYKKHLNKYHTIFINITEEFRKSSYDVYQMIKNITKIALMDLKSLNQDVVYVMENDLPTCLFNFSNTTEESFVIVIDEWDAILRTNAQDSAGIKYYLDWLNGLLKDKSYVALAYMTGILPIKKYGTQSALNMFKEYSMLKPDIFAPYIGFTEQEVKDLCERYGKDFNQMKYWYDGYQFYNTIHIYNPNSVISALQSIDYQSFWSDTETFKGVKAYISLDFKGLRSSIVKLMADESVKCNTHDFANDMTSFASADDVLTLLIHLGYLSTTKKTDEDFNYEVVIPNNEIKSEFRGALGNNSAYEEVYEAAKDYMELLKCIWNKDEKAVAKAIDKNHEKTTSILTYNDENSLDCVIYTSLLLSTGYYVARREVPAGKGFADLIYEPKKGQNVPALLMELKFDKSAQSAIDQIKERKYINYFKDYKGKVLLVGINYAPDEKEHECKIEEVII